jgi:ABC-type transport system substrate-binding protein
VSHTPGVELVMEAYEGYWRKVPPVKRLVYKSIPEATTRMAMLKRGEVDLAYLLDGPQAQDVKRGPNLKLAFSGGIGTFYVDFLDQWDPKSPWHDRRVRLAAMHAIDSRALNEAENLGASRLTGSIVPRKFEFALPLEPYAYDPAKAKQLLAEAGYPNGFDAGDLYPWRRRSEDTSGPWGSRRSCGRWSARPSTRRWPRRSFTGCASASTRCTGMPPRGWRRPYRATAPTPTAAIPTMTLAE